MSAPLAPGGGLSSGEQIARLVLPALPRSARWARRQVTAALSAWDIPADVVQSAEMVVSELAGNAVRVTSREPSGRDVARAPQISVALRLLPGQVVIEVTDNDPSPPALADAGPGAENGRGLVIVQSLSEKWGHRARSCGGKVVFAVISTSGSETAGHPGDGTPAAGGPAT